MRNGARGTEITSDPNALCSLRLADCTTLGRLIDSNYDCDLFITRIIKKASFFLQKLA